MLTGKTLHLFNNTVGQAAIITRTMREIGYDAASLSWLAADNLVDGDIPCDVYLGFNSTNRVWGRLFRAGMFLHVPWGYARLHFQGGRSLWPWELDVPVYRAMGRQVYFTIHGSEVRSPRNLESVDGQPGLTASGWQRRTARRLARWSTGLVVTTPDLLEFVPTARYIPVAADFSGLRMEADHPSRRLIRVAHAPTRRATKGTAHVIQAVDRLKARGVPVELALVEDRAHRDAIEIFRLADIVVDQLMIGWYGMVAVEAMALGKPVIAYIRDDLRRHAPDLPVLSATPATVEAALESLVCDVSLRRALGQAGRVFVEQFHDPRRITRQLIQFYAGSTTRLQPSGQDASHSNGAGVRRESWNESERG